MKREFYLFLILALILPVISAAPEVVKQGECTELIVLSNFSEVNLSTVSVGPNLFVIEDPMTNLAGLTFNYTYCNTSAIGEYKYLWYPCENLECSDTFTVTKSGVILNSAESILYIVLITINILVFGFFLYWAITLPYANKTNPDGTITAITKAKYIKLLSSLFAYGAFLWFFAIFTGIVNNFISLEVFLGLISNAYIILSGLGVGFTILILVIIFVEVWKDILLWEQIKKFGKAYVKK